MSMTIARPPSEAGSVYLNAVCMAATAEKPADWQRALDQLERAARLGHPVAQAMLAALNHDWALAAKILAGAGPSETPSWQSLRQAVRMEEWLAVPAPRPLSAAPRVAVIEDFLTLPVCDWLMARAKPKLARASTCDPKTGLTVPDPARDCDDYSFDVEDTDFIVAVLRARIAAVTGFPLDDLEATTILHYRVGQQFLPHYDFFDPEKPGYAAALAEGGQRALTFLISLNQEYEGGETNFPLLSRHFRGRKGTALLFWNVLPNGEPDRQTLHAGLPPTRGEKWIVSQWLRYPARPQAAKR